MRGRLIGVVAAVLSAALGGCMYYVRSPIRPVPALAFQRDPAEGTLRLGPVAFEVP